MRTALISFGVYFLVGVVSMFIGMQTEKAIHQHNIETLVTYTKNQGCRDLGPPDSKQPISKYVEAGFDCGGVVLIISK